MKCPYNYRIDCQFIDTSGMTKVRECEECPHFIGEDGIRATGSTPILSKLIDKLQSTEISLFKYSFKIIIELFGIEFCLFELWIKPWMKTFTIIGIESGNFMFHVLYFEYSSGYINLKKPIKIEIFGIKNFKWDSYE